MKLYQGKCRLKLRKRVFIERVVNHWIMIPRELVIALNLSDFKEQLDDTLILGSPVKSRKLELTIFMGPFQLELFYDSVVYC